MKLVKCEVCGEKCEQEVCPKCCDHSDIDNFYCLNCGADRTEDMMSRAYDRAKDYWKYGE